jgi:two-component system OmpR family sensor kinase
MSPISSLRRALARLSIRWRLALVWFGLLVAVLGIVGVLLAATEEKTLLANQAIALREHGELSTILPTAPTRLPPTGPFPATFPDSNDGVPGQVLVLLFSGPTVRATIIASDGTIINTSPSSSLAPPPVKLDMAAFHRALTTAPAVSDFAIERDSTGQRQLVIMQPIVLPESKTDPQPRTVGVLLLNSPTTPIERATSTIHLIVLLGALIALGLAAVVIVPITSAILRPLTEMEHASSQIAGGELSLRLEVPPAQDEIGRLAAAFNSMVAQLEDAFARQKQFVADVSHELRTPITAMSGGLEMLLLGADAGDPQKTRRIIQGMYAEVERMRRLIEDLLMLTRLDEGRLRPHLERVDVGQICERLCEDAQALAREQTVTCDIAANVPATLADGDQVREVLLNVLDNAIKHTPAGGQIALIARRDPESVAIAIRDTGEGITPEALPHVFERFYRADPARGRTAQRTSGAGLGLAIAKSLIEGQGGHVTIESEPGKGTTVTIHLRIADA